MNIFQKDNRYYYLSVVYAMNRPNTKNLKHRWMSISTVFESRLRYCHDRKWITSVKNVDIRLYHYGAHERTWLATICLHITNHIFHVVCMPGLFSFHIFFFQLKNQLLILPQCLLYFCLWPLFRLVARLFIKNRFICILRGGHDYLFSTFFPNIR